MAQTNLLIDELGLFAAELADASGKAIMPYFRTSLETLNKAASGRFDPVTAADRAGEAAIRALINRRYPKHGIIGEEYGRERDDAEFVWVLDPVDGTKSFISGMPSWGTLIGLLHHGQPLIGVNDQPFLGERFWGDGKSASMSGRGGRRSLNTRRPVVLADANVWASSTITTDAPLFAAAQRLAGSVRMLRYANDCYAVAMLAEGHVDLIVETGLDIYDIAAHVPIVTGAGGIVTALDGSDPLAARSILIAGDPSLHAEALALLACATG